MIIEEMRVLYPHINAIGYRRRLIDYEIDKKIEEGIKQSIEKEKEILSKQYKAKYKQWWIDNNLEKECAALKRSHCLANIKFSDEEIEKDILNRLEYNLKNMEPFVSVKQIVKFDKDYMVIEENNESDYMKNELTHIKKNYLYDINVILWVLFEVREQE